MRIGMWMGAPLRALGVVAVMALAACGGGSSNEKPAFGVNVVVDGTADAANPLTAGETGTIEVPSGATLVFDSAGETRWDPTATGSSFTVNDFSFTSKSMTVSSNAGGSLVVVFTDKADASQKATLNVTVAPKEFQRVAQREGELASRKATLYFSNGTTFTQETNARTTLLENDRYGIDTADVSAADGNGVRLLFDAEDAYLGWSTLNASYPYSCTTDVPVARVSYPMHVGKAWSGSFTLTCTGGGSGTQSFTASVTAFQRITVPAGDFDALRIEGQSRDGDSATGSSSTNTCWWAVEIGRIVKCESVYRLPAGASGMTRVVDELLSTSN